MGYPLSAVLLLLSAVLEDPQSPSSQTNVAAITEFFHFVKDVQKHGNDIRGLVGVCERFHEIALWAISDRKVSRSELFPESSLLPHFEVERGTEVRKPFYYILPHYFSVSSCP